MAVLILAEHLQGEPSPIVPYLIGAAQKLDQSITILVAGSGSPEAANRIALLAGVAQVWWSWHPSQEGVPPEDLAQLVKELASDYTHILAAASTFGGELIPRIAALLTVQPVTSVVEIRDQETFVRPMHGGGVLALMRTTSAPALLTVQPWAFKPVGTGDQTARVERIRDVPRLGLSRRLAFVPSVGSGSVDLSTAQVVVAGGGGLETKGDFLLVEQLAHALGGAVGASRTAVDAGLAPADQQIGQTGRIIAPRCYIALGISGAIQHLAGIKNAGTIVSINKDPQAPMAAVADLALTADLYEAVPALISALGLNVQQA
ncbi:MAG: electron transfer flavoprotein subunit alpha/FixB family protein [Magnetococcus sp. YQC-5]